MRFSVELDAWDLAAIAAAVLVVVGLFAWHWPAALVAIGGGFLAVYYYREKHLAAQPPDAPAAAGPDDAR